MNESKLKYASMIALLAVLVILSFTLIKIRRTENEMDVLTQLLAPVKQQITPSSVIGYDSNLPGDRERAVYFRTVSVLSPSLVVEAPGYDTLLTVTDPSLPEKSYDNYRSIQQGEYKSLSYRLFVSKK
ncbi:MAG: hypothetical protein J0H74_20795 [Chitinophagaceae bacterium]|nr:hypothetical protein [Chitinophagaceae bacterium]